MKTFKSIFSKLFEKTQPVVGKQYVDRLDLPIFTHTNTVDTATVESFDEKSVDIVFKSNIRKKLSYKEFQHFIAMP